MSDYSTKQMRKAKALGILTTIYLIAIISLVTGILTLAVLNRRDINRLKNPERHNMTDPGPDKVERSPDEDKIIDYHNAIQVR